LTARFRARKRVKNSEIQFAASGNSRSDHTTGVAQKKPAGERVSGRRLSLFGVDQGMSPATNFGMTGPPISAA
jgi:hypothetical protein